MIKNIFFVCILVSSLYSCSDTNKKEKQISNINTDYEFVEFHKLFFNSDKRQLTQLKEKYPYLFPSNIKDEIWMNKINDSNEEKLFKIADNLYPNLENLHSEITALYQHIKYDVPKFKSPKTFTLVNDLDYENSIIYADSLAFISLDMYLGKDSEVYQSFPKYISNNYTYDNITIDLAKSIIDKKFPSRRKRSFIESMIYFGKKHYLTQRFLPNKKIHKIIGTTEEKYKWFLSNEQFIWKYFITNKIVYSTNNSYNKRFIDVAPFSKFYLETDKKSPGRIGTIIGYKIVESYMNNNNKTIFEMLSKDGESILKESKYKPKK